MLKGSACFLAKIAKVMLIFFSKVLVGYVKRLTFFRFFLNIEYYILQIFSYIFQQQNVTNNVLFSISPTQRLRFNFLIQEVNHLLLLGHHTRS